MLKYVVETGEISDKKRFEDFLHQSLPPSLEKQAMTLAQQWQEEGFQKGIQQGMQQGECSLLLRLLERKFKVIPAHYRRQLAQADADLLLVWGERVLEAKTLEEIFE